MKKYFALLLLSCCFSQAQETSNDLESRNEIRIDVLQAVLSSKVSLSYERFFESDFSTGLNVNFTKSNKVEKDFKNGYVNNLPLFEINPFVRYALSKSKTRYYFAEVFASYNGGDYKEIIRIDDGSGNGYYKTKTTSYTDIGAGASLGYKMYFREKIALEFLVGFGYNFLNPDKSPDKITRVGLNLGYRF